MLPLRTDIRVKRPPIVNYALIVVNMGVFILSYLQAEGVQQFLGSLVLNGQYPRWWEFLTYQFIHADFWHLLFNMWFLWVFGNSINDRLGNASYLVFYLAGGAFAGMGYAMSHEGALVGASGSIAAVTTAFMVLCPRSRILFLFWFFIITTFELPALWVILFKIVLFDNVIGPMLSSGATNVAYSAHIFGYLYGFVATIGLLLFRLISRDQFDLLALLKRWNQRREFAVAMRDPVAQARAQYGAVARPIVMDPQKRREVAARLDRIAELRGMLGQALSQKPPAPEAIDLYEQLLSIDVDQFLARHYQLEIARLLYAHGKYPQAAGAFENYLKHYPKSDDQDEVRLLLGIVYARDLEQFEIARGHLSAALEVLRDESRRQQCGEWLERVMTALRAAQPTPEA